MIGTKIVREDGVTKWQGEVTDAPVDFLSNLPLHPLPITISGSNNVTFTLNCSTTNPRWLFNGRNFTKIDRTIVYTWGAVSNSILDSTGAQTTDVDSVLGVWYAYLDADMNAIWMSQTAPSYVEAPYCAGLLGHPGTSRNQFYRYIGIMVCTTAATPAFLTMTKIGYTWHWATLNATPTTAWLVTSVFTVRLPKLAKYGGMVGGNVLTGKAGTVTVSADATASEGVVIFSHAGTTSGVVQGPFDIPGPADASGELYVNGLVVTGSLVKVTRYKDVV